MRDFLGGDPSAFEDLYQRFAPAIFGLGVRAFEDEGRAGELVKGTFLKLRRRGPSYLSGPIPLEPWIIAQALGVALVMSGSGDRGGIGALVPGVIGLDPVPA